MCVPYNFEVTTGKLCRQKFRCDIWNLEWKTSKVRQVTYARFCDVRYLLLLFDGSVNHYSSEPPEDAAITCHY